MRLYGSSYATNSAMVGFFNYVHMVRSMHQVLENYDIRSGIWDEHRLIAEAIISGDPELARNRASEHAYSAGQLTYRWLTGP